MNGAPLKRPPAQHITLFQMVVLLSVSTVLLFVGAPSSQLAWSFLAGGLIAVFPQAWFAARLFRNTGAQSARTMVRSAYIGETGKYLFSIAGFAALFSMVKVNALIVFGAYLLMLVVQLLGSVLLLRRYTQ